MTTRPRISVLLEEDEYERFDAYCRERGYKKSTLIARLVREHLDAQRYRLQRELPLGTPSPRGG